MTTTKTQKPNNCEVHHKELNRLVKQFAFSNYVEMNNKIDSTFDLLYRQSITEDYYWQYCPLIVFQHYFEKEFEDFKSKKIDATESSFYIKQLNILFENTGKAKRETEKYIESLLITGNPDNYLAITNEVYCFKVERTDKNIETIYNTVFLNIDNNINIKSSNEKKIRYVIDHFLENNPTNEIPKTETGANSNNTTIEIPKTEPEVYFDFSDNSEIEKIVFLNQLGIIDLLRKKHLFSTSNNKLAEVISAFTGIKQGTAQGYINAIISKDINNKNYPLKEKHINTVTQKLLKMGCNE